MSGSELGRIHLKRVTHATGSRAKPLEVASHRDEKPFRLNMFTKSGIDVIDGQSTQTVFEVGRELHGASGLKVRSQQRGQRSVTSTLQFLTLQQANSLFVQLLFGNAVLQQFGNLSSSQPDFEWQPGL